MKRVLIFFDILEQYALYGTGLGTIAGGCLSLLVVWLLSATGSSNPYQNELHALLTEWTCAIFFFGAMFGFILGIALGILNGISTGFLVASVFNPPSHRLAYLIATNVSTVLVIVLSSVVFITRIAGLRITPISLIVVAVAVAGALFAN